MKKSVFILVVFWVASFSNLTRAQTLNDVLTKHFKAIGQDKKSEVKSFVIKAKVVQMGMEIPMEMKMKRPNKFRMEMEMQGQKMVQAFDGEKGWMIAPWISPDPQDLAGAQLKQAIDQADMDGELYNYEKKGITIDLVGKVKLDSTDVYRLKLTTKNGDVKNYYLDAKNYMILAVKAKVDAMGKTVEVEQRFQDYEDIDGIQMAMTIESKTPMGTAKVVMEDVKFNEALDDSIFERPVK